MSQAKTLTQDEYEKLFAFVENRKYALRNKMILLTGFKTGLRASELAAIRLGQFLNADKRVNAEFKLSGDQTKGRHPRTIYLSDALREELQTYIDLRGDYEPTHPVFVTAGGKAFTAAVMTQHLYWLFRKAGIDGASSHTLRRQFITKLASKGIGIKILATMAGHRSIQVTAKYIDTNPDMLRNAANLA